MAFVIRKHEQNKYYNAHILSATGLKEYLLIEPMSDLNIRKTLIDT